MNPSGSFESYTEAALAVADCCHAAAWYAFTAMTDDASSAAHYLATNAAEYSDQARFYADAGDDRARAIAQAKSDAYADALRVVDIAGDAYEQGARRRVRDLPPIACRTCDAVGTHALICPEVTR